MQVIDSIIRQAQNIPTRRIVLPEWQDKRMLRAAEQTVPRKIAHPVLLGEVTTITRYCQDVGVDSSGFSILDTSSRVQEFTTWIQKRFAHKKPMSDKNASLLAHKPLYVGALLLAVGEVDGMVAGICHSTADVVRSALRMIGLASGNATASSFFIVSFDQSNQPIKLDCVMADCALVIDPDVQQLADIAIASAGNAAKFLGVDPKIAMLSFSTHGSAQHPKVDKVQQATDLIRRLRPDLQVIGEIQMDAALIPDIAQAKMEPLPFDLPANVLIFPDLNAGNIGYKICQRLAGGRVVGPILQGFNKPVNDLSRGSTVDDIVRVIAFTSLQSADA